MPHKLVNRPGVAGAVLRTTPSLINSTIHYCNPLSKYLQTLSLTNCKSQDAVILKEYIPLSERKHKSMNQCMN